MAEMELAGHEYLIHKVSARQQLHLVRRLAPSADAVIALLTAASTGQFDFYSGVVIITEALSHMTDADLDYVIDHCLAAVRRKDGPGYAEVIAMLPGGQHRLIYEDMDDLALQARLVWEVVRENLANFSFAMFQTALPPGVDTTPMAATEQSAAPAS